MSSRRLGNLSLVASVFSLTLGLGCIYGDPRVTPGDDGGVASTDAAARVDGTLLPPPDAAGPDSASPGLFGEAPTDTDDSAFSQACLDGADPDHDTRVDCSDDECERAPSCCVGSTSLACCSAAADLYEVDLTTCADLGTCANVALAVVGVPTLGAGLVATVPDGANSDAGFLVDAPVDLRSGHLHVTASVVVPVTDAGTVDALAIGLFAVDAGGARSLPVAALQVSASRGDVAIVAGDTVVASAPIGPSASPQTLVLDVSPTGVVRVTGPGISLDASLDAPGEALRFGVLGRSEASTVSPVRLEGLTATRAACDVPAALSPAALTIDDRTGLYDETSVGGPSLVRTAAGRFLAFDAVLLADDSRAIFIGVEDTARPGTFVVEASATRPQPALRSSAMLDEVRDPALGFDVDHWVLFATGIVNGRRSIVRAEGPVDGALTLSGTEILAAADVDFEGSVGPERDAPGLIPGVWDVIVAREHLADGRSALVLLDVTTGFTGRSDEVCAVDDVCEDEADRTSTTILSQRVGTFEIDADEVSAPSVAYHRGVYRLYYAGRRGLRWSIGLAISADARYWRRPITEGTVYAPTGSGIAALGARDPDVHIVPDGSVELFFTAWNGVDTTIARATQRIRY